jgi:hypothetical protein
MNNQEPISALMYGTSATAFRYSMSVRGSCVAEGNGSLATLLSYRYPGSQSRCGLLRKWTDGRFDVEEGWGTIRLTLGRMLESAVGNGPDKLVLQQEVAETGRMDADVAALLLAGRVGGSEAALCRSCTAVRRRLRRLDLLIGVVDEIFLV